MRILMINYEYPPLGGGGGVVNQHLAEELSKEHQITLVTTRFAHEKPHEVWNGVDIFRVPVLGRNDPNAATLISMLSFFPASLWQGYRLYEHVLSISSTPCLPSRQPPRATPWPGRFGCPTCCRFWEAIFMIRANGSLPTAPFYSTGWSRGC